METVKLTGDADVARVIADVNLLAGQLQTLQVPGMSGKVPGKIPADAADQVKDLKVTVYTGADDQILRRLVVEGSAATGGATALLDLTLTKVGEDQTDRGPAEREALHRAAGAAPGRDLGSASSSFGRLSTPACDHSYQTLIELMSRAPKLRCA